VVGEAIAGRRYLLGELVGVREVDAHPRPVTTKHAREVAGDAHWQHRRHFGTDADELYVRYGPQARQQPIQLVVSEGEGIAPRDQHVAHFLVLGEVFERPLPDRRAEVVLAGLTDHARAGAVTAIGGAERRRQQQNTVRVTMHQAGHRRVVIFSERVVGLAG